MSPKSMIISKDWSRLKREHRFMQVHKYGGISLMEANQIFGRLDASCMRCAASSLHSTAKILMIYTKVYRKVTMILYQRFTLENCSKLFPPASSRGRRTGLPLRNFFAQTASFFPNVTITKYRSRKKKVERVKISFYQQSRCQQT